MRSLRLKQECGVPVPPTLMALVVERLTDGTAVLLLLLINLPLLLRWQVPLAVPIQHCQAERERRRGDHADGGIGTDEALARDTTDENTRRDAPEACTEEVVESHHRRRRRTRQHAHAQVERHDLVQLVHDNLKVQIKITGNQTK